MGYNFHGVLALRGKFGKNWNLNGGLRANPIRRSNPKRWQLVPMRIYTFRLPPGPARPAHSLEPTPAIKGRF
jgi:hypothetical protein